MSAPGRSSNASSSQQSSWGGRLFLAPGVVLYLGQGAAAGAHAHHAVQLVWSREGDATLRLADRTVRARAFLVPAGVDHAFDATGRSIALLLVESHGPRGSALDRCAREHVGQDVSGRLGELPFPESDLTADEALAWCDAALDALGARSGAGRRLSPGTRRVVDYVERSLDGVPRLSEAARLTSVSPTRLTHLFSTEVGIPFRRYVLWARLKRAIEATRRGANATEAAVAAGFSDSAHLSRTFRSMVGLPPSLVLPFVEIIGSAWSEPRAPSR